ncbi:MAG: alpha/beta hydrolase [Cetobacterium sp.]|uniref:alpha/beta hydrolase n=1 Tax=unclassified Cetobacterium TaxID=2630983 RepID=UPI000646A21B|nr:MULTISPECIES: alpha/beta hydrolase [unclassified Cetobacterium]
MRQVFLKNKLFKKIIQGVTLLTLSSNTILASTTLAWDKTFPKSDKVNVEKVSFYNRLGINVVGDLYTPKDMDMNKKYSALIVGSPYGAVKEQAGGVYAQNMAEKGYVTLAFDASYNGESGGQPRFNASPEAFADDFSAAVDFLGTRKFVNRNQIGVIGVCGSGSFALSAAKIDPRIKALATISMYDMGRGSRQGLNDSVTLDERKKMLQEIAEQRWAEYEGKGRAFAIGTPETIDENSPEVAKEFFDYYRTSRGQHPRSLAAMSLISSISLMNSYPLTELEAISPRPLLFIAGEFAHSRYFSEDAYSKASEPKELHIVPGAGHVDLYDRVDLIPFIKLDSFFKKHLK